MTRRRSVAMHAALMSGAIALLTVPAAAHMPYVLPSLFDAGSRTSVVVEASFTEDAFRPEVAMRDAPFELTGPDGRTIPVGPPIVVGDRTLVDVALPIDGVYRLSSGQRTGRAGRMYRSADGDWTMAGEGAAPPAGTAMVDVRSMTRADAYILRGHPGTNGAPAPRGHALEIQPIGDPTAMAPGTTARFTILYDGRPLAGRTVTLFRESGLYDGRKQVAAATSDKDGMVTITPPDAGRYLMLVRYRTATPGTTPGHASYTMTLAFEAG